MPMLQVPCLPISPVANDGELETMTLIVAIQTQDSIIMAADGMAYVQEPSDTANIPYEKIKIHRANSSWIIAFSGWAGIEVGHVGLEAEIERGLSDHFKSGQRLSLQNRPTEVA